MELVSLSFAAVALASCLRAVAPLSLQLRKPLACDLCMSFWCGLVVSAWPFRTWPLLHPITTLAAIGLAFFLLSLLSYLRDARGLNQLQAQERPQSDSTGEQNSR